MRTAISLCLLAFMVSGQAASAQKSIADYAAKNDGKKLQKAILVDGLSQPVTGKSWKDGHGKSPYFTSKDQLPKRIALVTYNITDLGVQSTFQVGGYSSTTYMSLTEKGGNLVAQTMYDETIETLKSKFSEQGVELLLPDEYLDTEEKKNFYWNEFSPEVSKLGKFLSNIENRANDISVCADGLRYFDLAAAWDFKRCVSMGKELSEKLGVDAVMSVGVVIQSQKKDGYIRSIKMAIHGPNPVEKEDKKYVAQKAGNGYNAGHIYIGGSLAFKKPIPFLEMKKKAITGIHVDGMDVIFANFMDKFYAITNEAVEKNAP